MPGLERLLGGGEDALATCWFVRRSRPGASPRGDVQRTACSLAAALLLEGDAAPHRGDRARLLRGGWPPRNPVRSFQLPFVRWRKAGVALRQGLEGPVVRDSGARPAVRLRAQAPAGHAEPDADSRHRPGAGTRPGG